MKKTKLTRTDMTLQEQVVVEAALKSLIDIGDRTADCARTSYCSIGLNEPIHYAITDAKLSLTAARASVCRANAAVQLLTAIRDGEED